MLASPKPPTQQGPGKANPGKQHKHAWRLLRALVADQASISTKSKSSSVSNISRHSTTLLQKLAERNVNTSPLPSAVHILHPPSCFGKELEFYRSHPISDVCISSTYNMTYHSCHSNRNVRRGSVLVIGFPLELKLVLISAARPRRLPTARSSAWIHGSSLFPTDWCLAVPSKWLKPGKRFRISSNCQGLQRVVF